MQFGLLEALVLFWLSNFLTVKSVGYYLALKGRFAEWARPHCTEHTLHRNLSHTPPGPTVSACHNFCLGYQIEIIPRPTKGASCALHTSGTYVPLYGMKC